MILKRQGMFETNSSSTHSLVIYPEDKGCLDTDLGQGAKVYVYLKDFGCDKEYGWTKQNIGKELNSSKEKLIYLATYAWTILDQKEAKIVQARLAKVIKETTGQILEVQKQGSYRTNNLQDNWEREVFSDSKYLKRVLFDPSYTIKLNDWGDIDVYSTY